MIYPRTMQTYEEMLRDSKTEADVDRAYDFLKYYISCNSCTFNQLITISMMCANAKMRIKYPPKPEPMWFYNI